MFLLYMFLIYFSLVPISPPFPFICPYTSPRTLHFTSPCLLLSPQSLSIWVSKSVRAPDPPMRLGCEGTEPPGPGRGGAGSAGGGAGLRVPGSPGRALPPVLHPRSCRLPRGLWSWGVPAAQGPCRDQRGSVQAPVGGTACLSGHCHQSVQRNWTLKATGGGGERQNGTEKWDEH